MPYVVWPESHHAQFCSCHTMWHVCYAFSLTSTNTAWPRHPLAHLSSQNAFFGMFSVKYYLYPAAPGDYVLKMQHIHRAIVSGTDCA